MGTLQDQTARKVKMWQQGRINSIQIEKFTATSIIPSVTSITLRLILCSVSHESRCKHVEAILHFHFHQTENRQAAKCY